MQRQGSSNDDENASMASRFALPTPNEKSPPGSETGRAGVTCRLGSLYTITPPVPSADDESVEDVDCD